MHTHVGVRGHERMIQIYNSLRGFMPHLLALSANSPFAEGIYTYLHSTRAQIFTRSFPRCNIPGAFDSWKSYADLINLYFATNSITEPTQVWWSLRPHPLLGTIEIRICDSQSDAAETLAVAALAVALVAKLGEDHDNGKKLAVLTTNELDENLWRAPAMGFQENSLISMPAWKCPRPTMIERLLEFTGDTHSRLGLTDYISRIPVILNEGNGAQKQISDYERTRDIQKVNSASVARSLF